MKQRKCAHLKAKITDALYARAEKENLDPKIVNSAVKDVQEIFSTKRKRGKRCLICGESSCIT